VVTDLEGVLMRMVPLIFRQGNVGLIFMLIHESGEVPLLELVDLAVLMAGRGQQ
jgi:hypothetical protein